MIFDKANEALKNWKSLLPMLRPLIKNETKNAVRRKKMNVTVAPNGTTIGVQDPNDNTTIRIPYQPACANVLVGNSVWVEWVYDNFSTAIAVTPGNGVIPSPLPVNQGGTGQNNMNWQSKQISVYDYNTDTGVKLTCWWIPIGNLYFGFVYSASLPSITINTMLQFRGFPCNVFFGNLYIANMNGQGGNITTQVAGYGTVYFRPNITGTYSGGILSFGFVGGPYGDI